MSEIKQEPDSYNDEIEGLDSDFDFSALDDLV